MPAEQARAYGQAAGPALVTIVLCTCNGSRFLEEQLESLLAQTYPALEIIVADDASSDGTVELLDLYARRDERIQVSVNSSNQGLARNFAAALARGRGEFIAPCDQDDIWLPDKIAALVAAIGERSMAYCDSTLVDDKGATLGYRMSAVVPMRSIDDPLPFAFGNCVSGHAMLFRRSLLEEALPVPQEFIYDWWLAAVAAAGAGIEYCDRSLVLYRQHGTNLTAARLAEMTAEAGLAAASGPRVRSSPVVQRGPGTRLLYLRATGQRLAAIKDLPGRHQAFAAELWRLWQQRESQWISPALWRAMSRHQDRLLALTRMPVRKRKRYCAEFFWGLRAQRFAGSRAWSPS